MHAVRVEPNLDIGPGGDRSGLYPGDKRAYLICMKKNVHGPTQRFDHVDPALHVRLSCRTFFAGIEDNAFRSQAEYHVLTDGVCQEIRVLTAYRNS